MSQTDTGIEPDDELDEGYDVDEIVEGDEGGEGSSGAFGRNFGPVPEGYMTATGFAKMVGVKPQVVFATAKSSKTFPAVRHPEDQRVIIPIEAGKAWWEEKAKRTGSEGGQRKPTVPTAYEIAQGLAEAPAAEGASTETASASE
jgi:hypothetical protein